MAGIPAFFVLVPKYKGEVDDPAEAEDIGITQTEQIAEVDA